MEYNFDLHMNKTDIQGSLASTLARSRAHKRLHDPDGVLASAAATELLESLAASGFVVTSVAQISVSKEVSADLRSESCR